MHPGVCIHHSGPFGGSIGVQFTEYHVEGDRTAEQLEMPGRDAKSKNSFRLQNIRAKVEGNCKTRLPVHMFPTSTRKRPILSARTVSVIAR